MLPNIELYQQHNQENAMKHDKNDTPKKRSVMGLLSALVYTLKYRFKRSDRGSSTGFS